MIEKKLKLNHTYSIVIFIHFFFSGISQDKNQKTAKIKETFNEKNYQLTIDEINLIKSSEINFDSLLYLKAYSQIKLNQIKEAQISISHLLQLNPTYNEVYFLQGLIFAIKGKYPDAISNFNKIIDLNPNHEKALYNRALAKGLLEDYKSAIKDLDKCISINPNYSLAYYNRGYWHEISENYNHAISDYKKAIELNKHYSEAYLALAYAFYQNNNKTSACDILNAAKEEGIEAAIELIQSFCK